MKKYNSILFAVIVWSLLVVRYGYRFGTGDHVEYLPYVLYLNDHSLFPYDYFLQGLQQKVPNERSVVCTFLSFFPNSLESVCFILHFLVTVTLVIGLQKLGEVITGNILVARIAVLINFFLLFDRGLGNVELYSDAVQASSISVVLIAFGLYYFFKNKFTAASVLMSVASIIHPVEGLTVFMVMSATLLYLVLSNSSADIKQFTKFSFIYALTAGIFIAYLLAQKFDGATIIDNETFFRIYHEFRHAHHYLFAYFPIFERFFFVFFIVILFSFSSNKKLFAFTVFTTIGTLAYILFTDILRVPQIANLQFYKVSQWLKLLAVFVFAKQLLVLLGNNCRRYFNFPVGVVVLIISLAILITKPIFIERAGIFHQYGSDWKTKNDIVDISIQINNSVDKNAVFIQPFDCTELKFFGRVSSWVDWKAFVKDQSKIEEWYRRIQKVYGVSIDGAEKGFALSAKSDDYFFHLNKKELEELKQEGVTHFITRKELPPACGKLILSNNVYAVYQL